ncbi:uncharacterized protein Ecym_4676 [Eremothecium cymbalariae DBVPG|uniref:Uncharacterized protein n=1 Tax=Eremothecium cymbalariae (strain CBS 270.75 / DBVPG 7215 / KCTC 17166 / NRRL Y-17582) TaxID=931890 RepID=G8JSH5_ERECY|nr:hypothetical protein Ecym_4676 [Eremothecium cymbalariae DBVPG\
MNRNLHSSPPRIREPYSPYDDTSIDTSFEEDYQLHSEGSVVNAIIDRRRISRSQNHNPLLSSPTARSIAMNNHAKRARNRLRDNRLVKQRGDMEHYVLETERRLSLKRLNKEADKYAVKQEEINSILDALETQLPSSHDDTHQDSSSGSTASAHSSAGVNHDSEDDDAELIRILEQREEYERWVAEEHREMEEMLEAFNIN